MGNAIEAKVINCECDLSDRVLKNDGGVMD